MKSFSPLYFIAFFITLSFFSCKKHEKEIPPQPDYIVGEWTLDKVMIYGVEQNISDCNRQTFMIFESNHDAESKYYTLYQSTGNCELHLHYRGKWSYNNGVFYFHVEYSNTSETSNIQKELHFINTDYLFVFENFQGVQAKFYFRKVD